MDLTRRKDYIYSVKLAKYLRLFDILDFNAPKIFGYNVYHIIILILGLYFLFTTMLSSLFGLYILMNDVIVFTYYSLLAINCLLICYKIAIILYYSKYILNCFDITCRTFLSYLHYNKNVFTNWRERSIRILYIFNVMIIVIIVLWITSPLVLNDTVFTTRRLGGSYSRRRMNIFNMFLMVSDDTYNKHFNIFYLLEITIIIVFQYFILIFDNITIIICFSLSSQLDTINDGIATLGYECSQKDSNVENTIQLKKYDVYDDLISILLDHQKLIQKLNEYYNIFRYAFVTQIFNASTSIVLVCFIAALNFSQNEIGNYVLSIKLLMSIPIFMAQMFMPCCLFGILNEKKNTIIFALYSSNWTEMDMKSKQLVLYAMSMNNSIQQKLKLTNTKIINLEMFTKTIHICYSILSTLINYNREKTN